MNIKTLIHAIALIIITIPLVYAGPDHDHNHGHSHGDGKHTHSHAKKLDDQGALAAASKGVTAIINQNHPVEDTLLDSTWRDTSSVDQKISKKGNGYYIVSFNNKESGKILYVLISDTGEIYDANFSGKFDGLKD